MLWTAVDIYLPSQPQNPWIQSEMKSSLPKFKIVSYLILYNNQINARALIGQSAVGYCAGKPTEKSPDFWIII